MATTTPNFGWPVPTSTDLVKDGATAIEALGDGIDTSMVDLKGGTTGQILSKASGTDMDFTWIANDQGDITGVTAGTGITGGGTSGTVTITNDMATTITASGDIVVGTGSGTYDNLPIGTTGQVLTADTTVSPYKVKWTTPASGSTFSGAQATANGTSYSYTSGVETLLTFATETFDTNNFHSTSTNTGRLTIPTGGSGKYLFVANGIFIGTVPSYVFIAMYKNGTRISDAIAYGGRIATVIGNSNAPANGSIILDAAAGDYFEIYIASDQSTGTKSLNGSFSCSFLGA